MRQLPDGSCYSAGFFLRGPNPQGNPDVSNGERCSIQTHSSLREGVPMPIVTVDAIEPIEADSKDSFNEIRTIQTLSVGLRKIADTLKGREMALQRQTAEYKVVTFGVDPDGSKDGLDMTACLFHWFGVSVCNMARLAGFLRGLSIGAFTRSDLGDPSKFKAVRAAVDDYLSRVTELSPVLVWRNKVGAHFEITDPRKDDNPATLDMSVVFPVTFSDTRYYVGDMAMTRKTQAGVHTSALPTWSVTEVFESLIPRYWPRVALRAGDGCDSAREPGA